MSKHYELNAEHLLCPMPVIKVQEQMELLQSGDTLTVQCRDPGALYDIPAWCRINGHKVLKTKDQDQIIELKIEHG